MWTTRDFKTTRSQNNMYAAGIWLPATFGNTDLICKIETKVCCHFTCTDSTSFIGTRESSSCTKRRDYSVSLWCYLTFVDKKLEFNFVYVIFGNDLWLLALTPSLSLRLDYGWTLSPLSLILWLRWSNTGFDLPFVAVPAAATKYGYAFATSILNYPGWMSVSCRLLEKKTLV